MKKTLLINIFLVFCLILVNKKSFAQTTLSPGDLVIVRVQAFGSSSEGFSFVPLVDLATGTIIKFTDCGWRTNNTFRDGESLFKWTATMAVNKGTVITCTITGGVSTTNGTFAQVIFTPPASEDGISTNSSGLNETSGDQWTAYQTFGTNLYTVYVDNGTPVNSIGSWDADATTGSTSTQPTPNSIVKNGDNLVFTGTVTGDKAAILAAVNNPANWTATDGVTVTYTGSISFGVLPIELTRFEGNNKEGYNYLTWQTASESQNKGFDIERSADGVRFEKIGFVTGKGTTSTKQDYRFKDESPNGLVYYRLKQLDFDGRFEYSKIIAIDSKGEKVASVFPNPSTGIFTITGIEDTEDETFTLINSIGQTLSINVQNNGQMDMSAFPSGVYYLRVASNGQVMKLVKE